MRIIIIAIIIYALYLILRIAFRTLASKRPKDITQEPFNKPVQRKFDPRDAEDADFEEIKKG